MAETPRELVTYLRERLGERFEIEALPGDASTRGYFRISLPGGERLMAAYYPEPVREQIRRFVGAYGALSPVTRVPRILHHGLCAIVQQDVGDLTLFEILETEPEKGRDLYRRAIDLLIGFQSSSDAGAINPPFAADDFQRELAMTREFWVEQACAISDPRQLDRLTQWFDQLSAAISRHPYVLCHRDFHGQNIHLFNDEIFVIDYQDLRLGPDTYDLASLLRDRGIVRALGTDAEERLIEYYRERSGGDAGLRKRYAETLLQRSIKIVGTFARQSIARRRHHYLAYIPPTLTTIRACIGELPEYEGLLAEFPTEPRGGRAAFGIGE
ncbi:MAG: aminoglycoside phosphotransferase family protein [Thermoanaerobaculia bacterium]